MVPPVKVPMDFGLKYLDCPSHCNLTFWISPDCSIKANSMIISYNSPVIEEFTTEMMMDRIEVDDFAEGAVRCFLQSCYSGKLWNINEDVYRNTHKMASVFKVSWMKRECLKFIKSKVKAIKVESSYEDQLFLFNEAVHIGTKLNNKEGKEILDLTVNKFSEELSKSDQFFVGRFLADLPQRSKPQLDVIFTITKQRQFILIKCLTKYVEENDDFDESSDYLLNLMDVKSFFSEDMEACMALSEVLNDKENLSTELHRSVNRMTVDLLRSKQKALKAELIYKALAIPNCLFLNFSLIKNIPDMGALMSYLKASSYNITNSYIMFDAMHTWADANFGSNKVNEKMTYLKDFKDIVKERNWKPIVPRYIKKKLNEGKQALIADEKYTRYHRLVSDVTFTPKELFENNNDIKFYFKHPKREGCIDEAKCGFIVQIKGIYPGGTLLSPFSIKVVVDKEAYPDDIIFNSKCTDIKNMHVALNIDNNIKDYPITWSGQPVRTSKGTHYWGQHRFYNSAADNEDGLYINKYYWKPESKIALVVYQFG